MLKQPDSIYFARDIVRCDKCGLLFVCPQPTEQELAELYNVELSETGRKTKWNSEKKEYEIIGFKNNGKIEDPTGKFEMNDNDPVFSRWRRRVGLIQKNFSKEGRVLDVGCNAGEFLYFAKKAGMSGAGIELSSSFANIAKIRTGFEIYKGTLATFPGDGGRGDEFDVVALWDVIEHLKNPAEDLGLIRGLMRPGGVLCVSTVNLMCYRYLRHKGKWRGFYEGHEHLSFFSATTLGMLLERCGFQPVMVKTYDIAPYLLRWLNAFKLGNTLEVYAVKKS